MSRLTPPHARFKPAAVSALLAAGALVAAAQPGYCWDKFGHQVITQIAYDHMTPAAKAAADTLIAAMNNDPDVVAEADEYKPYNFVTAGSWMDDLKSVTHQYNSWHYIDLPDDPNLTAKQVRAYTDQNTSNAYLTLADYCEPLLRNPSAPLADRARALGFFLHIAGDIHQPLHAIGRQLGGNQYELTGLQGDTTDRLPDNLHAFWDGAYRWTVVNGAVTKSLTASDLPRITAPGQDPVNSFAKMIESKYAPTEGGEQSDLDPADWAVETNHVATSFAFPATGGATVLSASYVQQAHDLACRQLVLAGLHEAGVLNEILGSEAATTATTPAPVK